MRYLFKYLVLVIGLVIGRRINILKHNGVSMLRYPEINWSLVPFPSQKGKVYNADNLATVNRHVFLDCPKFLSAKKVAEGRWGGAARDVSWRLNIILWATGRALENINTEEIFVECGTGKGYMAAAIAEYHDFKSNRPNFYLVDNYSSELINPHGVAIPSPASFAYSGDVNEVKEYFKSYPSIKIIKGQIPEILEQLPDKPIALLHIDLNNAHAEREALNILRGRLISGAIIIFDDYGGHGGQEQAMVHENFAVESGKELANITDWSGDYYLVTQVQKSNLRVLIFSKS